jgi:hypothetical protein
MLSPFLFLLLWERAGVRFWDERSRGVSSPSALIIYKENPELSDYSQNSIPKAFGANLSNLQIINCSETRNSNY